MSALLLTTLLIGAPNTTLPAETIAPLGTLWDREQDWCPGQGQSYCPQEGDLVFFSSASCLFACAFSVANSGHPWHVGMVVRDASGQLCLFEAGGFQQCLVTMIPVEIRLRDYVQKRSHRRIWIRRVRYPLTEAQKRCLTCFAEAQNGKRFACYLRIMLLGFPCRPLRPTQSDQNSWFCAELVCEAMRLCGTCPACWMVPEKTTPRDLFYDKRDVSCGWLPPETWSPTCLPPTPGPFFAPR